MKKILTLAIALVMVFAIAAPAFASGWDIEVEEQELKDIGLKIQALATEKSSNTTWNGGSGYAILEKTYPVIAGTKVHAVVTVTIPAEKNLSDDMLRYMSEGLLKLKIETSNLENVKIKGVGIDAKGTKIWDEKNAPAVNAFGKNVTGCTFTFEITANAEKSDKDAKIVAKLGVYNEWNNNVFSFEKDGKKYTVTFDGSSFLIESKTASAKFYVKGDKGEIDTSKAIEVNGGDKITKQVDNTIAFIGKDSGKIFSDPTDATYKKLKAQMDEIFGVLGFDYEGAKYMQKAHFTKYFGTVMEGTDGLTYPTGYVAELVTDDPSVNPPQTGDNASVVGFVMIAIALVAAAAVTVKKVRA